jgi:hypothetical protein
MMGVDGHTIEMIVLVSLDIIDCAISRIGVDDAGHSVLCRGE